MRLTGGCQCGAVRYVLAQAPSHISVCHCRMCQKASGGPFMAFGRVPTAALAWTRSPPATFASSNVARRGFCPTCGTPLTYQATDSAISITLGSLDDAAAVTPERQFEAEVRWPWLDGIGGLPVVPTDPGKRDGLVDHQHPDYDI